MKYNIGDILLYKINNKSVKSIKKYDKFYVGNIYNEYYIIHDINDTDKYTLTEKNLDDMFITLAEYRRLIIEDLL